MCHGTNFSISMFNIITANWWEALEFFSFARCTQRDFLHVSRIKDDLMMQVGLELFVWISRGNLVCNGINVWRTHSHLHFQLGPWSTCFQISHAFWFWMNLSSVSSVYDGCMSRWKKRWKAHEMVGTREGCISTCFMPAKHSNEHENLKYIQSSSAVGSRIWRSYGCNIRHTHVYLEYGLPTGFPIKSIVYLYWCVLSKYAAIAKGTNATRYSANTTNRMVLFAFLFAQCSHTHPFGYAVRINNNFFYVWFPH